ncbi:DUF7283 family protein [Natronobacterium gregoryi]|uniref:Uncharacterized protein n=2 Tax=Natronobacterium gregoryi TaxID=44930 RepID=L0AHL0_NATGS|nr:hypothetical protein [Natronobacterium gregoryi]AFZ72550.1 hypothetical protein Natgr_1333 [Natronobacterium gregoryi SP2]ELY74160.1 hypothetical protein C490_00625 [Natronobacterium gregoryi SP2]PLK21518.1 hypothetical protein CYV19_04315 [Natronobacterium gregoryi SP2]SFI75684.1 hypothetical protein SAMN05443661_1058 [Natronobacterium gregoryi]
MDLETPADAWYVWLAVSLVSLAMAGIAIGLPSGPPPDADRAANAIERVSGIETYQATTSYEHDADTVKIDGKTVAMRNDHGTAHSSIAYGQVVPVMGHDRLENVTHGTKIEDEYATEIEAPGETGIGAFLEDVRTANEENSGAWQRTDGEIRATTVRTMPTPAVSASVTTEQLPGLQTDELVFEYETNRAVDFSFQATGADGMEADTATASESGTDTVTVEHTEIEGNTLRFPLTVEIWTTGTRVCQETIESDGAGETVELCDRDKGAIEIEADADERGYLERSQYGTEVYHVTLVDA